ncbi:unnamed protein product [Schistosoma mattheei]|uniref:Uncharacterized protein n=1 Tax=Schistosoma mattheei TaxID=31246 RepID=A0A183PL72_9TREM|nr:unnamed protein product [Schistosoma mattheei]
MFIQKTNNAEKSSDIEPPVGICIQCQAKMSLQLQSSPSVSLTRNQSPVLSHGAGSELEESDVLSVNGKTCKSLRLMPLAALDLLRSRLSNAHEVTPVTYVATDLINDFVFSQHIKKLLVSGSDSDLNLSHSLWDSNITIPYNEVGQIVVCASSSSKDVTHRICRWELSLCSPIYNTPYLSSSGERDSARSVCLPMPTNVAVSYNNNSLVVPHARLFNDSSVCLSPDGRLLAAFVIPRETSCYTLQSSQSSALLGTLLAVYRLQPEHNRGQCLFARRFTASSPVCVDFSPLGDFLAVGLATTRIPSEPFSTTSESSTQESLLRYGSSSSLQDHSDLRQPNVKCSCQRQSSVACVFHLQRSKTQKGQIRRSLRDIQNIKHPALLDPVSSRYLELSSPSSEKLDRWHRLLLSAQSGISLNTIVWNANGSILYGTTKGLIVISHGNQSSSVSILPLRCTKSHMQSVNDCEISYRRKHFINQAQTITSSSNFSVPQSRAVI